jgi:tetratricopeptide (TPR) repeat protein
LTSSDQNVSARQRTIQATIEWSLDLLSKPERRLFEQLSVFAGGCTVESAREVCFPKPPDAFAVLELLGSLVDKSLLTVVRLNEQTKYTQLESFREYSSLKLSAQMPSEALELRRRHAAYFRERAIASQAEFDVVNPADWFDPLAREGENIRTAIRNALSNGDAHVAGELLSARRLHYSTLWLPLETMRIVETICVALEDRPPELSSTLWGLHAYLAANLRMQAVAESSAERAVRLARDAGDANTLYRLLNQCAQVAASFGDFARAQSAIDDAAEIAAAARPTARDELNHAMAAAYVADGAGDVATAVALYREAMSHPGFDTGSDVTVAANLARLELRRGDYRAAIVLIQEVFKRRSSILDRDSTHHIRSILMLIETGAHIGVHEYPEALALAQRTLAVSSDEADYAHLLHALLSIALISAKTGRLEVAAKLFGFTEAATAQNEMSEDDGGAIRSQTMVALATVPPHRLERDTTTGAMLRQKDAVALALALHLND